MEKVDKEGKRRGKVDKGKIEERIKRWMKKKRGIKRERR